MTTSDPWLDLHHRSALITGAAHGLGRSIAEVLVGRGARVVLADVDDAAARTAAAELGAAGAVPVDVRDVDAVEAAVEQTVRLAGGLDILVNNAGYQIVGAVADFDVEQWRSLVDTMLTGTFLCTRAALPHLRGSGAGRVINIASVHGLVASPFKSAYVAAKHGIVGFTRAVALEEARYGVTANAVCPGYIRTELAQSQVRALARERGVDERVALRDLLEPVPMGRYLEPREVASLVAYLACDAAAGMTGSAPTIDGGWTAR